ncbi:hypothetical protein BP00DRAFT_433948 [Aspergillus indologenus CBS 114.80]|uniref:Zn(2)-C6 fungal-type domain-containing protein n=1 Tax=Aspergillus indologenus CBS 114.80 TaxID=1450541 RepID=A0A2V5IJD3_9EURO|nr:hypothetical protein BP00DRAFT_433948 [Aspergillus indologenus CBS 114.80]
MDSDNRPRKACDLCYTRKIKCDGQEPRCSNCINYATECTHIALRRKARPRAQRRATQNFSYQPKAPNRAIHQAERLEEIAREAPVDNQLSEDPNHAIGTLKLPPLPKAMAMVGIFLNTFNTALPLFHADTLLRMVGQCYALHPRQRDPLVWAAINTVFALASQHRPSSTIEGVFHRQTEHTSEYLSNAQSVVSTVMTGDVSLLNVQTLLGMVMVLQTARDPTPALTLVSATMRLVHKLGLHNRAASAHLDLVHRRQHARVFWIAYILDKDLSLRAEIPPVQLDDDIDVDLPSSLPVSLDDNDNTAGTLVTDDGKAKLSYFFARIQLASIEGRIYRYLYSTQASKQSPLERTLLRDSISVALDEWRASIPLEFGAAVVTMTARTKPASLGFLCVLHSSGLQCRMLINRAQAMDEQWITGVRNYSRGISPLRIPPCWEGLVHEARDFVLLIQEIWFRHSWFRWITTCPYISATMLLTANNLHNVRHKKVELDIELIDAALSWLNDLILEDPSDAKKRFRNILTEAVHKVKHKLAVNDRLE